MGLECLGVVGGDRAEHGKAEGSGDLLGDVGDPRPEAGVARRHVGHRDRQQRRERAADPQADGDVGEEDRGEEARVDPRG